MGKDAVEIVRQVVDACVSGDLDALAALYHPDAQVDRGILLGPGEPLGGPDAVRSSSERAQERWEDIGATASVVGPGASPEDVLIRAEVTARPRGTSVVSEWTSWGVLTVRDGLVYRVRFYYDEEEAREAAGLQAA